VATDSTDDGIEIDLSERSVNIFGSRIVTDGVDGTREGIAIHRPVAD
jgi:hypothetical protein